MNCPIVLAKADRSQQEVSKKVERISVDDYLRLEERGEERHEYVHGAIYAMVGGTARHNLIITATHPHCAPI